MEGIDIALRAHVAKTSPKPNENNRPDNSSANVPISYSRFIAIDTEVRVGDGNCDVSQNLTIASFAIMNRNAIEGLGLIYNGTEITESEFKVVQDYCKQDPTVKLYELTDFIDQVFYPLVGQGLILTFYNAPWDISRLAQGWGYAKGWYKTGFNFKLSKNPKYPDIRIKHVNNSENFISFQSNFNRKPNCIIDSQKLAIILTDRKNLSLKEACRIFNKKYQKLDAKEYNKITKEFIDYNIRDTLATAELFTHLIDEFNKYGIDLPLTEVYSSASIGKAFLKQLGVIPFGKLNL